MASSKPSAPTTFEEALDAVLAEMREVMIDRQRKYGPDNIRQAGILGVLKKAMDDKMGRIYRVYQRDELRNQVLEAGVPPEIVDQYLPRFQGDFNDDSIEDAHIDGANFIGPISLMLRRGWWGLPMEGESRQT